MYLQKINMSNKNINIIQQRSKNIFAVLNFKVACNQFGSFQLFLLLQHIKIYKFQSYIDSSYIDIKSVLYKTYL